MTETKTSAKKDHPTYQQMICGAISSLKERNGSSRPAVKKYIIANYGLSAGAHFDTQISAAIRRGVDRGVFTLPKGNSGTIKLVKPEKKVPILSTKKDQTVKTSSNKETIKKVSPIKKSSSTTKKATPVKKVMKRAPVEKVEPQAKKVRKAPMERV